MTTTPTATTTTTIASVSFVDEGSNKKEEDDNDEKRSVSGRVKPLIMCATFSRGITRCEMYGLRHGW